MVGRVLQVLPRHQAKNTDDGGGGVEGGQGGR